MIKTVKTHNHSFSVYVNNDIETHFWEQFSNNQWEPESINFYFSKKRKGVFLDIGSWIGPVSLPMSQLYEKVYSVDFDPVAKERFSKNIELNNIQNIVQLSVGLSNKRGKIKLDPSWFGSSETSLFYSKDSGVEVELITFKDLMESIPEKEKISFIKIDIEGAEFKILSDLYPFLDMHSCITLISYHPNNMKSWVLNKWAWRKFKLVHALKQLRFKKYFISKNGVKEVSPYDWKYLINSRFALADALES